MKQRVSLFALVAVLACTGSCLIADETTFDPADAPTRAAASIPDLPPDLEVVSIAPGPLCECDTQDCREAWIRDNIGCDVCIVTSCPDQAPAHACVYCAQPAVHHTFSASGALEPAAQQ